MSRILAALGTYGLSGLDRLYRFMVVRELQNFISTIRQLLNNKDKIFRESLNTLSKNLHSIHRNLIGWLLLQIFDLFSILFL